MKVVGTPNKTGLSRSAIVAGLLAVAGMSSGASADVPSVASKKSQFLAKHPITYSTSFEHSTPVEVVTEDTSSAEPENAGFTGSMAPGHLVNAAFDHGTVDDDTPGEEKRLSEHLMYDMHQDMKDRFWHLNDQSMIEKLISEGRLDPSYGDQFDMNFVPTYQDDLFEDIFSEEPSTDEIPDSATYAEGELLSDDTIPPEGTSTDVLPPAVSTTESEPTASTAKPVPDETSEVTEETPSEPSQAPETRPEPATTEATVDAPSKEDDSTEEADERDRDAEDQAPQIVPEQPETLTDGVATEDGETAVEGDKEDTTATRLTTTTTTTTTTTAPTATAAATKPPVEGNENEVAGHETPAEANESKQEESGTEVEPATAGTEETRAGSEHEGTAKRAADAPHAFLRSVETRH
ncbi:conserved hypothetical protein [Neospora caninum Liverpool]|uniref:Uncharacterized protein n=1 Tax=Neospora caninum (strain Liverpool) TaxID=572307 RepID=F0VFR0_NEOCL|nr:conserved hypothetical protein [Neospora caninum Liverpool]CBZ52554.1 conserved hypothetical protein [Neospora caninum Liverpool]CEL66530.1 TPA: hypothetical protein BN1204_023420 [Neospora caninum Liverpool]|eukprot:XP_003882586.1 conserved hypothetical protein [Neospora caninum Liverpool]